MTAATKAPDPLLLTAWPPGHVRAGDIRLTEAGRTVALEAARRATGMTIAVLDAVMADVSARDGGLIDLIETAPTYHPTLSSRVLVRAFNTANEALGLARRAWFSRPDCPVSETGRAVLEEAGPGREGTP